jgi:hypothetical protein
VPNLLSFEVRSSSNVVAGCTGVEEGSMDGMVITTVGIWKRVVMRKVRMETNTS